MGRLLKPFPYSFIQIVDGRRFSDILEHEMREWAVIAVCIRVKRLLSLGRRIEDRDI
jgi:hypothetical protein